MRLLAALALVLLLTPLAAAVPEGATPFHRQVPNSQQEAADVAAAFWIGPDNLTANDTVAPGNASRIWFALHRVSDVNGSVEEMVVNVTAGTLPLANASLDLRLDPAATEWTEGSIPFTLPANTTANAVSFGWEFIVYLHEPNGTSTLTLRNCVCYVQVASVPLAQPPAPSPALPSWALPALGVVGVAVVVGGGVALYRSRQRRLMNEAPRRSQVMRDMALERELEKARAKDPERAAEIKQEIRAQEHVRETRRELQILEAKRADVLKSMELLKKRHEMGGLSKLQYDNMVAKKQADLDKVERDIAEMEAAGGDSSAAA